MWCRIRGLLVLGGVEEVPSIDENLGSVCVFVQQLGWFGFWMSDWEWLIRGKILFVTVRCMEFSCFLHTCNRMSQSKNKKEVERIEKEKSSGSAAVQEVPSLCLIYLWMGVNTQEYVYNNTYIYKKFHYFNN